MAKPQKTRPPKAGPQKAGPQQGGPEKTGPQQEQDARQMRLAGIVIALAMLLWLAVQALGREYGWAGKWAFLADLAAIGAFVWSLLVTWRIWRRRNA